MEVDGDSAAESGFLNEAGVLVTRGTIPFFGPSFSYGSPGILAGMECVLMIADDRMIPEGIPAICGHDTAGLVSHSASADTFHPERRSGSSGSRQNLYRSEYAGRDRFQFGLQAREYPYHNAYR